MTLDSKSTRSIFYLGTDKILHQISSINFVWTLLPDQSQKLWPEADVANGQMAVTYNFPTSEVWVYYMAGGSVTQLYSVSTVWKTPITLPRINTTVPIDTPSPSPTPTQAPEPANTGLSGGAKAGIGAGVTLGVLALVGTACTILFLRRRQQQKDVAELEARVGQDQYLQPSGSGSPGPSEQKPYSDYAATTWSPPPGYNNTGFSNTGVLPEGMVMPPVEADARAYMYPQELEGPRQVYEMPQENYSHEMMGEGHYREVAAPDLETTARPKA